MALDANWRENDGVFVCARSGNDSNAGTQALPKKTLQNMGTTSTRFTRRVRAGYYLEGNIVADQNNINTSILIATGDGHVIWDGSGFTRSLDSPSSLNISNLTMINHPNVLNIGRSQQSIRNCKCKNCVFNSSYSNNSNIRNNIQYSLFIDCIVLGYPINRCFFKNTQIFSGYVPGNTGILYNNFFSQDVTMSLVTDHSIRDCAFEATATNQCTLNSVNIKDITLDGEANTIGNIYGSNVRFSGTATVGGYVVTFTNCFYTDNPMFNDADNEDYTLQTGSPLINEGNIIGCYGVAVRFDATHPAFQVSNGASIDSNITVNGDTFELTSGSTGRVISSPNFATSLELPYFTYLTEAVRFFGGFNYNNGDWIDEANYNSSTNPEVRLTYKIRVYDESTSTWGTWYDIENFMAVERDSADLGNGDVNADIQNLGAIGGRNFQVDFVIRNNGV